MSRTFHDGDRRIRVRAIRHKEPDLRKLARALIDLAQAQAEAEAEQIHQRKATVQKAGRQSRQRRTGGSR